MYSQKSMGGHASLHSVCLSLCLSTTSIVIPIPLPSRLRPSASLTSLDYKLCKVKGTGRACRLREVEGAAGRLRYRQDPCEKQCQSQQLGVERFGGPHCEREDLPGLGVKAKWVEFAMGWRWAGVFCASIVVGGFRPGW